MPRVPLIVKVAVPILGFLVTVVVAVVGVGVLKAWWGLPLGPFTVDATQPIEFPHDVHVGETAQIDCQFCHRTVTSNEAASLPAVQQCYFCHQVIKTESPEVQKIIYAWENNQPLNWVRVHRLPDHVQFVHDSHVIFFSEQNDIAPSQVCSICHGDLGTMQIAEQVRNLKMRDCVNCHRGDYFDYLTAEAEQAIRLAVETGERRPPPTDCSACHY